MDAPFVSRFRPVSTRLHCFWVTGRKHATARRSLLLPIALLFALSQTETASAKQSFSIAQPPAWVQQISPPDSAGQSKGGITYLLADYQYKVSKATVERYYHQVKRVDSASGLEDISQL